MAEEFVAATVIALLEKTIADRFGLMPGFKGELETMKGLVRDIQALLADAEKKQYQDPTVLLWLKDFKGAALEAEYVLDELLYESLRRKVHETKRGAPAKVCSFFSMSKHDISFRVRMSSRVRAINAKLKYINHEALGIELVRLHHDLLLGCDADVTVQAANRQTDSLVAGRRREESEIVDMLLLVSSDDNNPRVSVLPVVGMGGLGKTTLAKSIYSNGRIVNHFSKRCWICVSDKFEVTCILKGILESLKGGITVDLSTRDAIVRGIQKELSGERFLFVLDDVCNTNPSLWDRFLTSLVGLDFAIGSCCVVTTRLQTVANLVSTSSFSPFILSKLSHDDCWFIIGRKAAKGGEMPEEFEIYKEEISKKCQGLPLAANVIGGLLSLKRKEDWLLIVENKILKVSEIVTDKSMPILKLSYDCLPYLHIKKCFAYCSIYSKDTVMDGQNLIKLWMAHGYLQDDMLGRTTTMEEDGAGCLKILLQSSLLEKKDNANYGDFYQMHDLVHDLAESISQRDGDRSRYVALGEKNSRSRFNENSTLIQVVNGDVPGEMLMKYRHTRVMILSLNWNARIPKAIGRLKHIRCLTVLLGHGIKSLPESLCKLYNLQTLRLIGCRKLECLPQGLSNLISLRHLHFFKERKFRMPPNMGRLACLQTLEFFNVWKGNGHEIKELGSMENLRGSLSIRNLELVKGKEEASLAKLDAKENMIKLDLRWGSTATRRDDEDVLEGLEPCLALQELRITNFTGVWFPRWFGKLSALVSLKFFYCVNITELGYSGDGGFPNLKSLCICGCRQLSSVRTPFPVLEDLFVENVQVSGVRDIISTASNSLRYLWLGGVSGMNSLSDVIEPSSLSSCLKKLEIRDCDDLTEIPSPTLECCTCLESLTVVSCPELVSCPLNLQQTPCLSVISFSDCPKLFMTRDAVLPRGFEHLTNLKELRIGSDNSMDWDGLRRGCSTTLGALSVRGSCLTQLPQQLEDFSSLVLLSIACFDSLERLPDWLAKLTSLRELRLYDCPKLEHLPTDAMNSLQVLRIDGCPLLRETQGHEIQTRPNLLLFWPESPEYNRFGISGDSLVRLLNF